MDVSQTFLWEGDLLREFADDVDDGSDLPLLEVMTQLSRYVAVLIVKIDMVL